MQNISTVESQMQALNDGFLCPLFGAFCVRPVPFWSIRQEVTPCQENPALSAPFTK